MTTLKTGEKTTIKYTSIGKGVTTERVIIPSYVPSDTVKAMDVSDLTPEDQQILQEIYAEYNQYQAERRANTFTFENWLEHTQKPAFEIKWRTFKLANIG